MQKSVLIVAGLLTVLVVLFSPAVSSAFFAMIFLGMIPGTKISLPSWAMLIISVSGIVWALRWISRQPLFIGNYQQQEKTARQLARKRVLAMSNATPVRQAKTTTRTTAAARRRHAKA